MKMRFIFLIPEAICLFFFIYPLTRRVINSGNLVGILIGVIAVIFTLIPHSFGRLWATIGGKIVLCVCGVGIAVLLIFSCVMSVQMVQAMHNSPHSVETIVVLGCKVNGDEPSTMLERRLETAYTYLNENESVKCVVTGGKGDENRSAEGDVMAAWLIDAGIDPARILVEDEARSTQENMLYTASILEEEKLGNCVIVVTDGYHQYRAALYAQQAGLSVTALNARTNPLFVPTYWAREVLGLMWYTVSGWIG